MNPCEIQNITAAVHAAIALLCPFQRALGRVTVTPRYVGPGIEAIEVRGLWLVTGMQLNHLRWVIEQHRPAASRVILDLRRPAWAIALMDQLPYLPARFDLAPYDPLHHPLGHHHPGGPDGVQ